MADEWSPFADVRDLDGVPGGFSLPELKWRELVFVRAVRHDGDGWLRDASRPLPPFARQGLFPEGWRFEIVAVGGRVEIRPRP